MANSNLTNAKRAKNDEFYTQFSDIQKEVESYLEYDPDTFKGKVVYSNCDDPFESNFFRYFVLNFNKLGLKQLITTSYKPSPVANTQLGLFGDDKTLTKSKGRSKVTANKFIINEVGDVDGDGSFTLKDIAQQLKANKNNEWTPLEGDGDFRSDECVELLKRSDIVVTNPPFSLFREYITQLFEYNKQFLIIGNMGSVLYKEIFPFVRDNKIWLGNGFHAGNAYFSTPNAREYATGVYDEKTGLVKFRNCIWVTNIDHGKRHQPLALMTIAENLKFNKKMQDKTAYEHYDNYDAIEVPFTNAIPSDYDGIMGVPVSFLDKYSPEQFEIVGMCENEDLYKLKTKFYTAADCKQAYIDKFGKKGTYDLNASGVITRNGLREKVYQRILIKRKKN